MYNNEDDDKAINNDGGAQYEDDEEDQQENPGQGGSQGKGPEASVLDYEEEDEEEDIDEEECGEEYGEEEDEEFQKIRREHVFAEIDFTKRKSKIICTLG
jgi:hypothetical protein